MDSAKTLRPMRAVFLTVVILAFFTPSVAHAAAQLAAGAKTSAQPTSTNPQQRQLQITFDPGHHGKPQDGGDKSYNVTSFELSVKFDPNTVYATLADIELIDPYNGLGNGNGGNADPPFIDNDTGLISHIHGSAPVEKTQGGDVNIFSIEFHLKDSVDLSKTQLTFEFGAKGAHDFLGFTNPNDPSDQLTITGDGLADDGFIQETMLQGTFNDFAAEVPVPQTIWVGAVLLALLGLRKPFAWRRVAR
jgi:hypothetical protein